MPCMVQNYISSHIILQHSRILRIEYRQSAQILLKNLPYLSNTFFSLMANNMLAISWLNTKCSLHHTTQALADKALTLYDLSSFTFMPDPEKPAFH